MTEPNGSAVGTSHRPRTRQRIYKQPPALPVPNIEEDAAERKRVLNVLAQRRYREKKRMNRLKANAPASEAPKDASPSEESDVVELPSTSTQLPSVVTGGPAIVSLASPASSGVLMGLDLGMSWDPLNDPAFASLLPDAPPDFLTTGESSSDDSVAPASFEGAGLGFAVSMSTVDPSTLNHASNSSSEAVSPDSYHLHVHELTHLRAMLRIAERIGAKGSLWSLDCISPFNTGEATPSDLLPASWRPTSSQIIVPHHPFIDFLPWPGVRDRVINILTMPEELRPPQACGPLGLVNFAYDVEDNSEGVRIYGDDPYNPKSWEVGQLLFERWWFLFDRDIIERSNQLRELRGAAPLLLKGNSSPGASRPAWSPPGYV